MSPSLRRYLPFILMAFVLLILLPALFRKSSSTATTPSTQASDTRSLLALVDRSEQQYDAAHGRYTAQVADLLDESHSLAGDLTDGYAVELDVSSDGQSYYALVESSVLNLLQARRDGKIIATSCTVVKSESGVSCPSTSAKSSTSSHKTT